MPLLENLLSPGTIERLGWMLVHFLWQAAAVALLLAVLQRLLRRAGANARYAAACGALVLMVVLPVVTMQFVEVSGPVAEAGPPLELPSSPPVEPLPVTVIPAAELPPLEMTPQEITDAAPPVPLRETIIAAVEPALPYVVLGWLAGVLGLSAWHLGGWTQLHRLKRRMAREADARLRTTLKELAAKLGIRRAVTLLESALVEVPTVLGWLRPVILIPASALTGLTPDQLRAILAHELAHIRRCDYLANILQTVVEILGFYHPAVWWVSSRIRIERENCCDDLAVHVCGNSLQYARALTCLEETRHSRSDLALAASGGSLMARIARLLGRPAVDDRRFAWLPGLIALLLVIGVIIPAAIVLASPNTLPATHSDGPEPNQVLVKFSLFPSASPNKVVDLETRNLLAGILAKENLQPLREIVHADPQQNVTLGELLETWVAKKPMMPETMGVVIDVLQSRGYLQGEAMAETLANDNQAARISIGSTEMLRSPTDPTSAPRSVMLGTFVEVTPHLSQQSPDRIRLDLLTRWTQRDDPNDRSDAPIISTTEMTTSIAMLDGQCVALATENTGKSDARLYMLLVSPTKVVKPQAAHTDTTVFVEVLHKNGASEPNETQIHTDWVIAKVRTETVLDRTTRRLIGDVLAAEKPQAAKELADGGEMTLGQAIRKYAASQSLSPETGQALISLLKTLELATIQASSSLIAVDGRQFELRNISGEWFMSRLLRPAQAGEEPNLIRLEYGTTIKGTARAENDASVTLDMDVWSSEPEPKADPNGLPVVRRAATSTTVNVPGDRYFSLLLESPNRESRQTQEVESLLVMVKPSITKPAPQAEVAQTQVLFLNHTTAQKAKELLPREYQQYVQPEDCDDSHADEPGRILTITAPAAIADAIQKRVAELDKPPRQVLLDVRVVEMKRASLLNLGVEWSLPPLQTGGFYDGGDWTKAISIGYSADSTPKSSLLAALNQLETTGQGEIVTNPQIVALDGGTAQLRSIREEWFLMSGDPSTFLPPELQNIESGTIVTMTPHVGDNNDIALEMAIEASESLGRGRAPDLPIVTRRQAKNKVTIMNGGTVAVAGLTARSAQQTGQTMNELAIFVTATLVPENGRVVSSIPSPRETASPGARAGRVESANSANHNQTLANDAHLGRLENARRMHANLDPLVRAISVEIARIEQDQIALRQTRAEANPELVRQRALLDVLQDKFHSRWTELEQEFDRDLLVLSPRTMADRDAYVNSDPLVQDLAAGIVSMEKELSVLRQTHLLSHPTLQQKQGNLQDLYRRLEDRRKTLRDEFDAGARTVRQRSPTDPQRISATFTRDDLLAVLARISEHFGEDIAVDRSVRTQPITAGLVEASMETALREILRETPYTFKRTSETNHPTYLVYRPIAAEFEQADLLQALDQIAEMAEVPIIPAPSVQGRITAQLKETDLEAALKIILQGTPFVFKRVGNYYVVGDSQSGDLGPLGMAVHGETQIHSTTAKTDSPTLSQIRPNKKQPAQIFLDVQIVEMERTDLTNLIAQWNLPAAKVDQTPPDGHRPEGIQIAFLPDRARTDSFWDELRLLVTTHRARIMDNPQAVSTDGRPIELLSFGEVWAHYPDAESARKAARGREECRKVLAGTSLLTTATVADGNSITLEMELGADDRSTKRRRDDRPIAMQRLARDSATVTDGGIVVVAGLPVRSQTKRTTKMIAVFVAPSRIPEDDPVVSFSPSHKAEASSVPGARQDESMERRQPGISGTFTDTDVLSVLERIASHFRAQIAVELVDAPFEAAVEQTLRGTLCAFKRQPEGDYLVYRPITATFDGNDLQEALRQIASMTRVPISIDPKVRGTASANAERYCLIFRAAVVSPDMPSA